MAATPRADPARVAQARALRAAGWSIRRIAAELGAPRSTIARWTAAKARGVESLSQDPGPAGVIPTVDPAQTVAAVWTVDPATGIPAALAGPHPLRPDRQQDHPEARGLVGWRSSDRRATAMGRARR
ncbi:MAG TPA: helix-turn-helix domain-containing protein [Actinomycetes bacterium]|jgi:transcriptional regulator with XRE-family HTH domain